MQTKTLIRVWATTGPRSSSCCHAWPLPPLTIVGAAVRGECKADQAITCNVKMVDNCQTDQAGTCNMKRMDEQCESAMQCSAREKTRDNSTKAELLSAEGSSWGAGPPMYLERHVGQRFKEESGLAEFVMIKHCNLVLHRLCSILHSSNVGYMYQLNEYLTSFNEISTFKLKAFLVKCSNPLSSPCFVMNLSRFKV